MLMCQGYFVKNHPVSLGYAAVKAKATEATHYQRLCYAGYGQVVCITLTCGLVASQLVKTC